MSYDFGQFAPKKKKVKKKEVSRLVTSAPPRPRPPRAQRTAQIDIEKLTNTITLALDEKLQSFTQMFENQAILSQAGLQRHDFTRENLILFMAEEDRAKSKLCYMEKFFRHTTSPAIIDNEVKQMKKEGLIRTNKCGWMRLSPKGWNVHKQIIELSNFHFLIK